jgi:hypothetical protein
MKAEIKHFNRKVGKSRLSFRQWDKKIRLKKKKNRKGLGIPTQRIKSRDQEL